MKTLVSVVASVLLFAGSLNAAEPDQLPFKVKATASPQTVYTIPNFGCLVFDGKLGTATFVEAHGLDIDSHSHGMPFVGVISDSQGRKYNVGSVGKHSGKYFIASQEPVDGSFRVFCYDHGHYHLISTDVSALPLHKH